MIIATSFVLLTDIVIVFFLVPLPKKTRKEQTPEALAPHCARADQKAYQAMVIATATAFIFLADIVIVLLVAPFPKEACKEETPQALAAHRARAD